MRIFSKFLKKYNHLENLETKIFWGTAPSIFTIGIVTIIVNILEGLTFVQLLPPFFAVLVSFVIMLICDKTGNFQMCYDLLAIGVTCVVIPLAYIFDGGLHSGMPLICIISIVLPCFCYERKRRLILTTVSILVQSAFFIFEILNPTIVNQLWGLQNIQFDIIICYLVGSFALLLILDIIIEEFKAYALTKEILNKNMDIRLQRELFNNPDIIYDAPNHTTMATVLFADVSNYTSQTEGMTAIQAAEFLNVFFEIADVCIYQNGGILDKYMGDCVMAFWPDEGDTKDSVIQACKATLEIREKLHRKAEEIHDQFGAELDFEAGIHYGQVIIGGVGSKRIKSFTAMGDTVNIANKLQSLATRGTTYISQAVYDTLGKESDVDLISDSVMLKGKVKPMVVYSFKSFDKNRNLETLPYVVKQENPSGYMFHICGCRGSYSVSGDIYSEFGGDTSCYVIKKDTYAIVIDCGTGLYKARKLLKDCDKIDILLTHVHYDHILGLLDFSIFPADAKLRFYGDFDNWEGPDTISNLLRGPFWPVNLSRGEIISIKKHEIYTLSEEANVSFYDSHHPNSSSLLIIRIANRKLCILADCEDHNILPREVLFGCDMILYDGMYSPEDFPSHTGWGHSTWQNGVALAKEVNPSLLVITHHNPVNSDKVLHDFELQAKALYPSTLFARDGHKISL